MNHLDETVSAADEFLGQSRKRLADLHGQVEQPFEYAIRLAELAQRQQALVAALDLNQNAGASVEAPPVDAA